MNQQIVDYLQTNKDEYTKESRMEQLRNNGHSVEDITEAINIVYGDAEVPMSLAHDDGSGENVKYAGFWIWFFCHPLIA